MQSRPGEIPVLDNLRAIAAWSVCLYHFICKTLDFVSPDTLLYKTFDYGRFGVQLFFIISGMVIPWSLHKNAYRIGHFGRFLLKRIARLEPPYLFSILLVLALIFLRKYWLHYGSVDQAISVRQVLLHLGYLVPFFDDVSWLNNVYWTLAIEFQFYLLVGLLYFLFVSPLFYIRIIGYGVLLAGPVLNSSVYFLPDWLPLFGIGILLFQGKSGLVGKIEFYVASLAMLVALYIWNEPACVVVATVGLLVIQFGFNLSNKVLTFLGKFSYSVYLVHPVLGAAFINVASHYVQGVMAKAMLVAGGMLVTVVASYVMYLVVEKPSRKLSSSIKYYNH